MSESEIPADVLKAARAICAEFDPSDTAICIAIMRERERCAEIVRPFTMQGGTGGAFVRKAMWSVLDAIRQDNPNAT